jgi:hypothetical protein
MVAAVTRLDSMQSLNCRKLLAAHWRPELGKLGGCFKGKIDEKGHKRTVGSVHAHVLNFLHQRRLKHFLSGFACVAKFLKNRPTRSAPFAAEKPDMKNLAGMPQTQSGPRLSRLHTGTTPAVPHVAESTYS